MLALGKDLSHGTIVGERYRMLRELGHGGFGRTYLGEDLNRFGEKCVLKEFAPKVQGTQALKKASELFAREAGVLYKLQHRQIPKFRELLRAKVGEASRLFLVQDYVEGWTYSQLLQECQRQGKRFTEAQGRQLLLDLLPVLDYIHSLGVIHRDISPDNLIWRRSDQLPVLIDFGGVKQVAANLESEYLAAGATPTPGTILGKLGYAPPEQWRSGAVYPHSDLYALAVTVVVLLTGREPQQLFDDQTLQWRWLEVVRVEPLLAQVLQKMLSARPGDRFLRAGEVLQALHGKSPVGVSGGGVGTEIPPELAAPEPGGPATGAAGGEAVTNTIVSRQPVLVWWHFLLFLLVSVTGGAAGWWGAHNWVRRPPSHLHEQPQEQPTLFAPLNEEPELDGTFSEAEKNRKQALSDRRVALGVDFNFFGQLVDEAFYEEYPEKQGVGLGKGEEDAVWRERWDTIAELLLDRLSAVSDEEARRRLGLYGAGDRERWRAVVKDLNLSISALYDLADAKFYHLFPQWQGRDFLKLPVGQVWYAIVSDTIAALENGTALEEIRFPPGAFSTQVTGTLPPGGGKAYIAYLSQGQILRINLQADAATRLSVYAPSGNEYPLLEDSAEHTWNATLSESGYYEITVVSADKEHIYYNLNLAADQVTNE
ncbi:MAG: hypothetical protein Fur0025_10370 [Oscillatoriaceae cyanobacterium]